MEDLQKFDALPEKLQADLLRSMRRFALGQCRREDVDRVLDLVLALEILASSGKGDNAPPSWKVSVRSAQLIGGVLAARKTHKKQLTALYQLRSAATHGGK